MRGGGGPGRLGSMISLMVAVVFLVFVTVLCLVEIKVKAVGVRIVVIAIPALVLSAGAGVLGIEIGREVTSTRIGSEIQEVLMILHTDAASGDLGRVSARLNQLECWPGAVYGDPDSRRKFNEVLTNRP